MGLSVDKKRIITFVSVDGNGKSATIRKMAQSTVHLFEEPEEVERNYTLYSKAHVIEGKEESIFAIDTPGSLTYLNDVINTIKVSTGSVFIINATSGASEHSLRFWRKLKENKVPVILYVNMMDDEHADFDKALDSIRNVLKISPLPIVIPIGKSQEFNGVINLISQKMYTYKDTSGRPKEEEIPEAYMNLVEKYREKMMDAIVETDENLMQRYFDGKEITSDELRTILAQAVKSRLAFPVLVGSASKNIGIDQLKNAIMHYIPNPSEFSALEFEDETKPFLNEQAPLSAYVFKTRYDNYVGKISYVRIVSGVLNKNTKLMISNTGTTIKLSKIYTPHPTALKPIDEATAGDVIALDKIDELKTGLTLVDANLGKKFFAQPSEPKRVLAYALEVPDKKMEEKVVTALKKITEDDPGVNYARIPETKELVVYALGQLQFDVINYVLREKYKLEASFRTPRIQYRETIKKKVEVQGKHKKQSGGHGQYGDVWIRLEPLPRGKDFEFVDDVVGGSVPRNYIPSVEKGVRKSMDRGFLAGYPVIDLKVTLFDGSSHPVDSSDMAFQIAASIGFKKAMELAEPVLLEPIMNVSVNVPERYVGTITNDLSGRRGRITGMDSSEEGSVVMATVPLSEMSNYATELHSMTQGLGLFEMEFNTYEELPPYQVQKVIDDTNKWKEKDEQADF